jgi:putative ABC transport system ATP-binding protein
MTTNYTEYPTGTASLELRNVSKGYGEGAAQLAALRNASPRVDGGTLAAVMGPSGSGKSTLLTIAGTIESPASGQVIIDVGAISGAQRARLRRRSIGYVFETR